MTGTVYSSNSDCMIVCIYQHGHLCSTLQESQKGRSAFTKSIHRINWSTSCNRINYSTSKWSNFSWNTGNKLYPDECVQLLADSWNW